MLYRIWVWNPSDWPDLLALTVCSVWKWAYLGYISTKSLRSLRIRGSQPRSWRPPAPDIFVFSCSNIHTTPGLVNHLISWVRCFESKESRDWETLCSFVSPKAGIIWRVPQICLQGRTTPIMELESEFSSGMPGSSHQWRWNVSVRTAERRQTW